VTSGAGFPDVKDSAMCEYFVKADPIQYEQRTRTIRIHGVLTSIRLENMVWDILAEMAEAEERTTNNLIVQLHDEILAHRGEVPNFASFLRVTSMRFLRRKLLSFERADGGGAVLPNPSARTVTPGPSARVVAMGSRT
jgi:predicted DNA-binding ribbon-helix-helix protein